MDYQPVSLGYMVYVPVHLLCIIYTRIYACMRVFASTYQGIHGDVVAVIVIIVIIISISISIIIIPATIRPIHHIHPIRHNMPSECIQKEQKLALGGT